MSEVITLDKVERTWEFLRSEGSQVQLIQHLSKTILQSFNEEKARGERTVSSTSEVRRRTNIYIKWLRILRADIGYSLDRTLDLLPTALRKELDGIAWEPPPKDTLWAPKED